MNRREQIIKYLDGQMSEEEKLQFEKMLAGDGELQKETDKVRNMLSVAKTNAEPEVDETYFINMLPEFHARRSKKKKIHFAKIAYSLSTAAAVVLLVFVLFKPGSQNSYTDLADLSKSFSQTEIDETINQYAGDYSISELAGSVPAKTDSIVTNIIADELDLTPSGENAVAERYFNTDEILSSIDESEANELYSQLINEDIIKGERQ